MTDPYFWFWLSWVLGGVGVELYGVTASHREGHGTEGVQSLSRFTQWLVRAHTDDADISHLIFLLLWGFLAIWFPGHIYG